MKVALIGYSQSGKSTLLASVAGREPAPSGSQNVEEVIVPVNDERLVWLTNLYKPKKVIQATIDCLDLPGLNFLDQQGRLLSRKIISEAKTVDMFVIVVRAFEADRVAPYRGCVNPKRDMIELSQELILTDLDLVLTRIEKLEKQVQRPSKTQEQDKKELELQLRLQKALEDCKPARTVITSAEDQELSRHLGLITTKPLVYVVNTDEGEIDKQKELSNLFESIPVSFLSAKLEYELSLLDPNSRDEFMKELGIKESAAAKFISTCYEALGLISFLTVGEDEVRAWPIKSGSTALDAAGKIHSDIQRGFIRAETMAYNELKDAGSEKNLKAQGRFRLEGKTYLVQDGDIINFRFNV